MTLVLVANLSIPITDDDKVKDALQNSLQWEYGEYVNPIHSLFLLTPKLAIVHARGDLSSKLLSQGNVFQLGGPLSATFQDGRDFGSDCIEIHFRSKNIDDPEFLIIDKIREFCPAMSLFLRNNRAIIRFPTSEAASEALAAIMEISNSMASTRILSVSEHVAVKCSWRGAVSLSATVKRLKRTGQNLTNLIQSCLSVWPEQPLVITIVVPKAREAQAGRESPTAVNEDIVLICATELDAEIIRSTGKIDVIGGSSISVKQNEAKEVPLPSVTPSPSPSPVSSGPESGQMANTYILWDFDSCHLSSQEDAAVVADNILTVVAPATSSRASPAEHATHAVKLLFVNEDVASSRRPTATQQRSLHDKGFRTISVPRGVTTDNAMKTEVDQLQQLRARDPSSPPISVCVLFRGDQDFSPTLATLRLQGITKVSVVCGVRLHPALTSMVGGMYPWASVRGLHTIPPQNREMELMKAQHLASQPMQAGPMASVVGATTGLRPPMAPSGPPSVSPSNVGSSGAKGASPVGGRTSSSPVGGATNGAPIGGFGHSTSSTVSLASIPETAVYTGGEWLSNITSNADEPRSRLSNYLSASRNSSPATAVTGKDSVSVVSVSTLNSDESSASSHGFSGSMTLNAKPGALGARKDVPSPQLSVPSPPSVPSPLPPGAVVSAKAPVKKSAGPPLLTEIILELQWLCVATHFKNLIAWGQEEQELDEHSDDGSVTRRSPTDKRGRPLNAMVSSQTLLLGEVDGTGDSTCDDGDRSTIVTVMIDTKIKSYKLKISGTNAEAVDRRCRRMDAMVNAAIKDRKLHTLAGWEQQHRECIMGSMPLIEEERESQATALFHYNEGTILAEIVALSPRRHRSMWRFLEGLGPRQAFWTIPREAVIEHQKRQWVDIKQQFAVVVDKDMQATTNKGPNAKAASTNVALRVWGFGTLLDQALTQVLQSAPTNIAKAALTSQTSPLVAATTDASGLTDTKAKAKLLTKPVFQANFVFQDREAGIFYQTFEDEFRRYVAATFNVDISETASNAEGGDAATAPKQPPPPPPPQKSGATAGTPARAPALRVDFAGSTQRDVNACRAYLEQLNTSNLPRHQVYFPRVDAVRYKDLLNHKARQDAALKNVRRLEMTAAEGGEEGNGEEPPERAMDPLETDGFVNIRIKPPLHSRGIKRMTLPADICITVCGPVRTQAQLYTLSMMEQYFEHIESDHYTALVEIPSSCALARILTVRTSREEFITTHGLVGLRFEEGSRSSGVAGTAKIWAASKHAMTQVLEHIENHGGQPAVTVQMKPPPLTPNFILGPGASYGSDPPPLGLSGMPGLGPSGEWDQLKNIIGRHSSLLPGGGLGDLPMLGTSIAQSKISKSIPNPNHETAVIRWPHQSFRFMFLGEPLKRSLNELLESLRTVNNILTTCPYRDKTDQAACLLLEGLPGTVAPCADRVNTFMRSVSQQMRCLQLLLSDAQRKALMAQDLAKVKEVQGMCGVHLVLDPQPTDLSESASTYDIRLPCSETPIELEQESEGPQPLEEYEKGFRPPHELISVLVTSKVSGHAVMVSVMNNKACVGGWNWGVNNLLLVLDGSADAGLNPVEIEQLNRGEVLVNAEATTGRRILRVRPDPASMTLRGVEHQAESLVSALSRGLAAADSLSLTGVAVVAPLLNQCFSDIPVELVRSLTVEAVVAFIHRAPVRYLERVLCIEILPADVDVDGPSEYSLPGESSILLPAGGDRMATTMLLLLEQANDPQTLAASASQNPFSGPPVPSIRLLACNVSLLRNMIAESLVPPLQRGVAPFMQPQPQLPPGPPGPIIIRGLMRSLVAAIQAIRKSVAPGAV